MKNLKKLSWQIPFLLFLILGTYYTLTQNGNRQNRYEEKGSIADIPYEITFQGSQEQQKALNSELSTIRQGMEHTLQSDTSETIHPDTVSVRMCRMIIRFMEEKEVQHYHIQVGNQTHDKGQ